jgi:putative ABC transport system substrate-binding protein
MANVADPGPMLEMHDVQAMARAIGLAVTTLEIRQAEDIATVFEGLKARAEALYVCGDPLTNANRIRINTLALGTRLPTVHSVGVEGGGLISYGVSFAALFRRAAEMVDNILRGAKPADIPVEPPIKFDLIINLTTARALGLEIPPSLLARADEVIE